MTWIELAEYIFKNLKGIPTEVLKSLRDELDAIILNQKVIAPIDNGCAGGIIDD